MKKLLSVMLVASLCIAFSVPAVVAAEKDTKSAPKKPEIKKPAEAGQVTQGELAQLLVNVLGLARFLPAAPSPQQCFAILLDNSISPSGGWVADKVVTKADLARILVQAMKKQGDIKNPDDPKAWIDYLKGIGVPLDAVGESASYVDPLVEPVAPNVVSARVDPLVKRHKLNPLDETQYGVDMEQIPRILSQFEFVSGEFRPKPVTPD